MIRIVIADDHALVREGLRRILNEPLDMEVIGEAADGQAAIDLVRRLHPDVLVLDLSMPVKDGLDVVKELAALRVFTRILILTIHNEEHYALRTLRAGAHGFIYKGTSTEELLNAIRAVAQGIRYLPPELERAFAERYVQPEVQESLTERLSDREFQVLCLIASGYTNREIAEKLHISVKTVDSHRRNVLKKLHLRNNADLTRFALKHGLISE
jgi:DNA-binding NarL/FixJ family response regulator